MLTSQQAFVSVFLNPLIFRYLCICIALLPVSNAFYMRKRYHSLWFRSTWSCFLITWEIESVCWVTPYHMMRWFVRVVEVQWSIPILISNWFWVVQPQANPLMSFRTCMMVHMYWMHFPQTPRPLEESSVGRLAAENINWKALCRNFRSVLGNLL